jgi:hypothetical protein
MKLTKLINFLFEEEDYRGLHRPPGKDRGAPLWDLTHDVYPDDIYTLPVRTAARYYGHSEPGDIPVMSLIRRYQDKPDAQVVIYRSVPDVEEIKDINPGNWVSIYRPYAEAHGESGWGNGEGYKILEKRVKARELYTDGNSIYEWGWDPS